MSTKTKSLLQKILIAIGLVVQTVLLKHISSETSGVMVILRLILSLGIVFCVASLLSGSSPGGTAGKKGQSKEN